MVELGSFAAIYLCFGCLHAAHLGQARRAMRPASFPRLPRAPLWAAALVLTSVAIWLEASVAPWPDALLLPLAGLFVVANLFVLLAPLFPRVVWGVTLLAPLLVIVALLEAHHG